MAVSQQQHMGSAGFKRFLGSVQQKLFNAMCTLQTLATKTEGQVHVHFPIEGRRLIF